jgi:hypothetical protein
LPESAFDFKLVENRVFLVVLVFNVIAGFYLAIEPYFSVYLFRIGYSTAEYAILNILLSSLFYLVDPLLYLVVLYYRCGGPLLNRIASVLTSLVLGSLVGYWIGGTLASVAIAGLLGESPLAFSSYTLASLPQHTAGQVFFGLAILALSELTLTWTKASAIGELQRIRPSGLTVIVFFYLLFALLNILSFSFLYFLGTSGSINGIATAVLAVFSIVIIATQIILAIGLYSGRKWAWVIALISAGTGLLTDISVFAEIVAAGAFMNASLFSEVLLACLFFGFLISIAVFFYLLSTEVRRFFGFVNPAAKVQSIDSALSTQPS